MRLNAYTSIKIPLTPHFLVQVFIIFYEMLTTSAIGKTRLPEYKKASRKLGEEIKK